MLFLVEFQILKQKAEVSQSDDLMLTTTHKTTLNTKPEVPEKIEELERAEELLGKGVLTFLDIFLALYWP